MIEWVLNGRITYGDIALTLLINGICIIVILIIVTITALFIARRKKNVRS